MEKVVLFGEKKNLVGVVSEPSQSQDKPFMIILNSGLVHRPGPFRMNTELSRFLAKHGYGSFRFDLSGVGDSERQAQDSMVYKDRNLSDIGEAIDFVKEMVKPNKIIIMGLCTGADLAHKAAVKFEAVSGAALLDGYGYPTAKFYVKRYGPILVSPKRIMGLFSRLLTRIFPKKSEADHASSESGTDAYYWVLPDKQDYIADMKSMQSSGKKHFYGYTSGVSEYYNYEDQFFDTFKSYDFVNDVTLKYYNYSDHTFVLHAQRWKLFDDLLGWLKEF